MAERFSCALRSQALGEPCYGTASRVRRWILVEQPGGWGADAVAQSRLPSDVARDLRAVARSVGARLLLIRRHGRSAPVDRTCYAAVSTPATRRVERLRFRDPAELLAVDWSPLRRFSAVGGEPVDGSLYLVCTNGSHDVCCAQLGRPVARALEATLGERVWEVSHIGGDRFAGNLVCLPDGIYYGRIGPDDATHVVREHQAGRLDLERYRGRSSLPFVAQAAEQFVREAAGLTGIDEALPRTAEDLGQGVWRVVVDVADQAPVTATVRCSEAIDPQQLTCRSSTEEHPPRYALVSLEP